MALAAGCGGRSTPLPQLAAVPMPSNAQLVARGEYIVRNAATCGGCHAAEQGKTDGPLSGGTEFKDWRLGTIRASNLTPDSATGLGRWTDAEIVRALRNGESRDGSLLAPVMPYGWLNGMSDEDALAVARYLKSLAPVSHVVSQQPNIVFKTGRALFLRPKPGDTRTAPPRAASAAYGGYLAKYVALCADCHTPRGGMMATPDMDRLFAGDAHPSKDFPANPSNISPDSATGIGRWTEADFIRTIRTGIDPKGDTLNPFMPWHENSRMTDDDLRAIYRYLRTVPPISNAVGRRH